MGYAFIVAREFAGYAWAMGASEALYSNFRGTSPTGIKNPGSLAIGIWP